MDPIVYSIQAQRILLGLLVAGLVGCISIVTLLEPEPSRLPVLAFFLSGFVVLACTFSLLGFWWEVSVKKQIITIAHANQIMYQASISSGVALLTLVLAQIQLLNIFTMSLVILMYAMYWLWITAKEG